MRKIGIFGGTFDPVHKAHIELAVRAKTQLELDFVIMLPNGNPPHKRDKKVQDAKIRYMMLKSATKGTDGLIVSDYEVRRKEYSYTADTLSFFKRVYPEDKLYFIMGGDSIDYFDKWYKPEKIASMASLAVYARGKEHRCEEIAKLYDTEVVVISGEFFDISSSEIRQSEEALRENTSERVYEFITRYRLYRDNDEMTLLKEMLSEKRLKHSLGVSKLAKSLAKHYRLDEEMAERAGLLHDIAKEIPYEKALLMCDELGAELDGIERTTPFLVHPKLGAELVKCCFGITEGEITSAIRVHTVGKMGMSLFEKIIFVADCAEETRHYDGVDKIRETAYSDIDKAVVMCIDNTIELAKNRGGILHPICYKIKDELSCKNL